MRKTYKRLLSTFLALAMVIPMLPVLGRTTVTAVEGGATEPEDYLVNMDFEDGQLGGTVTAGNNPAGTYATEVVEKNGSKVLHMKSNGTDYLGWSVGIGDVTSTVTMTYDVAVSGDLNKSHVFFPSFSTVYFRPAVQVGTLKSTDLRYKAVSGWKFVTTKDDSSRIAAGDLQWHTVKMIYRPSTSKEAANASVWLYIDGKLTDVTPNILNEVSCKYISICLNTSGSTDNEIFVDNIKVYKSETLTCNVCAWVDSECVVCGAKCVDHDYLPATCIAPRTCSVCGKTDGEAIRHSYTGANGVCVNGCERTAEQNEVYNSLIYFDFEDGNVQGTVTQGSAADISVQTFNNNKVLAIKPTTSAATRWEVPLNGFYSKVTLSYNVAIPDASTTGQMMFPTVTDNTTFRPNVEFGANKGALKYSITHSTPKNEIKSADGASTIGYKEMQWYTVKIIYDYDTTSAKVFIDDLETNIGICREVSASQKITNLVVKFYNTTGALYLDDLRVTVDGVDHNPLGATTPLISFDHGVSNGDLGFTGDTLDFTMDFEDVEENYYPGTLALNNVGEDLPDYFLGVKEINGNKVLYMEGKCVGARDHVDWYYTLNGNHKKATLSYYVSQVSTDPQQITYPGLSNRHHWNPIAKIGISANLGGELMWYRDKVGWKEIMNPETGEPIRHNILEWHQVKIVYDATGEEAIIKVYIDGVLTEVGDALLKTDTNVSHIAVRMCGDYYYDGKLYMDNFKVTVDDHEPMEAPKSLISATKANSLTVDQSNLDLTVGGHQYITPTVGPEDTGDPTVTYISSDPSVATVDEWGEVIGVAAGNVIITVTAKSDTTVKIQIPVTVTNRSTVKTIYVSANGGGNGTSINSRCTLQEAMAQVSASHSSMTGDIVVSMAAGYYQLTETLEFDATHGGTNNHYVTYKAEGNVTIGGKKVITGWTEYKNGIYSAPAAGIQTRHLYVNNVRAVRARSEGTLLNAEFYKSGSTVVGYTSDNVELAQFAHPEDLEFVYHHRWQHTRNVVDSVALNETQDKVHITMSQPGFAWQRVLVHEDVSTLAYYENALELLDEPGEWYLDTHAGVVYYMPRSWENMNSVEISVPVVEELISIEGTDYENKVQNIEFVGITFADATWNYPTEMGVLAVDQNNHLEEYNVYTDKLIDGALTLKKTNSINFTGCIFTRLGSIGLKVVDGAQNSMIVGNQFFDISGGAVAIGEPDYFNEDVANPSDPAMMMKNCDVINNYIHNVAVDYQSSAGLSVGYAANVDISHNEIFDVPYSGMHIGYGWKMREDNILKNMRIENNFIHDTGWGDVADGGPIYVNGNTAGTKENPNIIANNYITRSHQAVASIYPDGGASGWYVTNNFVDEQMHECSWYIVWNPVSNKQEKQWVNNNYITYDKDTIHPLPSWAQFEIEPGIVVDPENLPAQVLAIIANAGLESEYEHLRGTFAERVDVNFEQDLEIKNIGGTFQIVVTTYDGFGNITNSDISINYSVEDSSIATVTADGMVTGLATGSTVLKMTVISGTVSKEYFYGVYVGDILTEIKLGNSNTVQGGIVVYVSGTAFEPVVLGNMALGREIIVTDLNLSVADTAIAYVKDGKVYAKAVGKTMLTITGRYEGVEKTITCDLEVKGTGTSQGNGPVLSNMTELFDPQYKNYWKYLNGYAPTGGVQYVNDTLVFQGQYEGTFVGATYLNELLTFGLHIDTSDGTGGWPAIVIRKQDASDYTTNGTCYVIGLDGTNGIEFYRFNDGKRTQFYGTVIGFEQILGPDLKGYFNDNTYYEVQCGAINEENGVRIILKLNGEEVINYLDTSDKAIREAGYFGVCGRHETITLTYIPLANSGPACVDENKDHICDDCGKSVGIHAPAVGVHTCDYCGQIASECSDSSEDQDHKCDTCGAVLGECFDEDNNHKCDDCGLLTSSCVDENKDHVCDMCGRKTRCADKDPKDHLCDTCGKVLTECEDKKPKDHKCDTCGKELSQCADEDSDHKCDICKQQITQCADDDNDGKCDICGAECAVPKADTTWIVVLCVLGALATGSAAVIIILRKKRNK